MSLPVTGLIAGLLLALAAAVGGWSAFALAVLLGGVGCLVGAQLSGRIDLVSAVSSVAAAEALLAPAALDEPGHRGALTVSQRAVEKIARAAALGVRGVAPASATSGRVSGALGRDLPRADADVAGSRARLEVAVASVWPHPAAVVAADVRAEVTARLGELAAITADAVSVTIAEVVRASAPVRVRVR